MWGLDKSGVRISWDHFHLLGGGAWYIDSKVVVNIKEPAAVITDTVFSIWRQQSHHIERSIMNWLLPYEKRRVEICNFCIAGLSPIFKGWHIYSSKWDKMGWKQELMLKLLISKLGPWLEPESTEFGNVGTHTNLHKTNVIVSSILPIITRAITFLYLHYWQS